jgi:hypothetical protein
LDGSSPRIVYNRYSSDKKDWKDSL